MKSNQRPMAGAGLSKQLCSNSDSGNFKGNLLGAKKNIGACQWLICEMYRRGLGVDKDV